MASRPFDQAARRPRSKSAPGRRAAIPAELQGALQQRLKKQLQSKWSKARIDIVSGAGAASPTSATKERRRGSGPASTALPLFRLEYTGDPRCWLFALFRYSHEDFAPSLGASGSFTATPEQAFDCAARLYLA